MRLTLPQLMLAFLPTLLSAQGMEQSRILDDPKGQMAKIAEQAFLTKPHDPEVIAKSGYLLFASGDRKKAEEQFRLATTLKPKNAEVRYYIAHAYLKFGTLEEAGQAFRAMVVADPSDKGLILKAAGDLFEAGQAEDATRMAQRAYALDPKDLSTCLELAEMTYKAGDKELGAKYLQRARECIKASDTDDLLQIGLILADQERGTDPKR